MDEINPYAPPAASVQVRDADAKSPYELPIELVTPGLKVLLFFGLGTLFVSMVFGGIIAALVFFVWDVHRPPPALLIFGVCGIPALFGVFYCGRVISTTVQLDAIGIDISTLVTRKYAWSEISSWQQQEGSGVVSFTATGERVRISNAATNRERNKTIGDVFRSTLGPPLGAKP